MNRLSNTDRCRVLACLVEGNSIRATERITGIGLPDAEVSDELTCPECRRAVPLEHNPVGALL